MVDNDDATSVAPAAAVALVETRERLAVAEETIRVISSADGPYRSFVENMQEGAATVSSSGAVLFANERLGILLGCPPARLLTRQLIDFVAEADRVGLREAVGSARVGTTIEVELQRFDGDVVAALVGISHLDVDDEPVTCLTFTDLTAEHHLLAEVRASQQRFEALYEGAPVPAYIWQDCEAGLILVDYNEAADRLTGGTVANALGSVVNAYYGADPRLLADVKRCLKQQVVVERETVSLGAAPGEEQQLHITMVPVPPDLVVVHTQDVTESWLAERALRASEERYRTIVENAQEGISILDDKGRFTFANRRTAELLGQDARSLSGKEASQFLGTHVFGDDRGRASSAQFEVTATRPDNSSIDLLVSTAPILLSEGGKPGSLCMLSDVSGIRQAEEELAHWALH
ncbi:MAG: PAS domain S-box protein, partial [Mycobacteriales bacterium]